MSSYGSERLIGLVLGVLALVSFALIMWPPSDRYRPWLTRRERRAWSRSRRGGLR